MLFKKKKKNDRSEVKPINNDNSNSKRSIFKMLIDVLLWIVAVFIMLFALLTLTMSDSFFPMLILMVAAVLTMPLKIFENFKNRVKINGAINALLVVITVFAGIICLGISIGDDIDKRIASETASSTPPAVEETTSTIEPVIEEIDVEELYGTWTVEKVIENDTSKNSENVSMSFTICEGNVATIITDEIEETLEWNINQDEKGDHLKVGEHIIMTIEDDVAIYDDEKNDRTLYFRKVPVKIEETETTKELLAEASSFSIRFIDVGQGDSALIECDGHYMLIDGGDKDQSSKMYTILKNEGIDKLDIVVASHGHADHIGGLAGALNYASADLVLSPCDKYDSNAFNDFKKYADKNGNGIVIAKEGDIYKLGSADIEILASNYDISNTNNTSIVLLITYGENRFIFTGDAEYEVEQYLCDRYEDEFDIDVIKVGHHGSDTSSSYRFLRMLMPEYAIISVGKDNSYGHPTETVLSRLSDADCNIYRTDIDGDIYVYSDGKDTTIATGKTTNSSNATADNSSNSALTVTDEQDTNEQNIAHNIDDTSSSNIINIAASAIALYVDTSWNGVSWTMYPDEVKGTYFKIEPSNSDISDIRYSSSDETIAVVDAKGNITAIKEGRATITATINNGISDYVDIEVISRPATVDAPVIADTEDTSYVVNKNTMKFHHTWCSSVSTIKAYNRWDYTGTRDELINMGYQPCKKCDP